MKRGNETVIAVQVTSMPAQESSEGMAGQALVQRRGKMRDTCMVLILVGLLFIQHIASCLMGVGL